jgi:hypothetical protein
MSVPPKAAAPLQPPRRVRLANELAAAVPVLLPELRSICAEYLARQFIEWDAESVGHPPPHPIVFGPAGTVLQRSSGALSAPQDPAFGQALVEQDTGVRVTHEDYRFGFVFGTSTLRQSGLTRWAVRLMETPPSTWHGIGLTSRTSSVEDRKWLIPPAESVRSV